MKLAKKGLPHVGLSKKPLKKTKPLLKTVSLKRSLSKPKPRKTLEQKTAQQLVKVADAEFSRYIRLRDSHVEGEDRVGNCITCGRLLVVLEKGRWNRGQNGHFISRGVHITRFNERNCNLQCEHCNAWRDKEAMLEAYRFALDLKYGVGTNGKLKRLSTAENAYKILPKAELLEIIETCRAYTKKVLTE